MSILPVIKNPYKLFSATAYKRYLRKGRCFCSMPDSLYLKLLFRGRMGKRLHLDRPVTFNEKLNWLKLNNRKKQYTKMVDKNAVKDYVANVIGEEYVIPTLGVWDSVDDIPLDKLPEKFVLKTTHDSGGVVICSDRRNFDIAAAKEKIQTSMNRDYYSMFREWPYKNVKKRIIAEEYIGGINNKVPEDYKIFTFGGKPKLIQVDLDRFINHTKKLYNTSWKEMDFEFNYPGNKDKTVKKPPCLDKMLALAEKLAKGTKFLRVDLYQIDGRIYFGELTFFPASGLGKFKPEKWDRILGSWIDLEG